MAALLLLVESKTMAPQGRASRDMNHQASGCVLIYVNVQAVGVLKRDRCRTFLLLAMTIVVVSCGTRDETIEPDSPSFGQPLVEPLPLRVGYAFDPTVDQEVLVPFGINKAQPIGRYHLRLGPATRTAFERVFTAVFVDAVDLADEGPAHQSSTGLDGTIELRPRTGRVGAWSGWLCCFDDV
jgi:hypothetical protein